MEKGLAFNWRQSPAHIWFLTTFLKPRQPEDHFLGVDWRLALGEPPHEAIQRFLKLVILTQAPLTIQVDAQFTHAQLKQMCRDRELPVSGNKDELISRLIEADRVALQAKVNVEVLQCTDFGRQLAEQYLADPQSILHQPSIKDEGENPDLPVPDKQRVLRWLWEHRIEVLIGGVISNAVYDALKELAKAVGEAVDDLLPPSQKLEATYLAPGVKLEWCFVPTGYFLMGSADNDRDASDDERPQHRVYVDAFYLGKYPVTNEQYRIFVQKTGHKKPYHWRDGYPRDKADHPVTNVNWNDTLAFCEWATKATGVLIRLLTEAEWEKGARGTDGRTYPWGNTWHSNYCNTEEAGIKGTTPVSHYPRGCSPYGAYDMAGNVWEWTSTIYKPYPYKANDGREDLDPGGEGHVVRGGSWWLSPRWARAACRVRDFSLRVLDLGFRVGVAAPFS